MWWKFETVQRSGQIAFQLVVLAFLAWFTRGRRKLFTPFFLCTILTIIKYSVNLYSLGIFLHNATGAILAQRYTAMEAIQDLCSLWTIPIFYLGFVALLLDRSGSLNRASRGSFRQENKWHRRLYLLSHVILLVFMFALSTGAAVLATLAQHTCDLYHSGHVNIDLTMRQNQQCEYYLHRSGHLLFGLALPRLVSIITLGFHAKWLDDKLLGFDIQAKSLPRLYMWVILAIKSFDIGACVVDGIIAGLHWNFSFGGRWDVVGLSQDICRAAILCLIVKSGIGREHWVLKEPLPPGGVPIHICSVSEWNGELLAVPEKAYPKFQVYKAKDIF
ncbi:hypothetical protein BOTBODRAFT_63678 [Botryobasidium botryosum FD-172 SS1]|uniref:Uncharacterized protein n=1 Tax=Botryobasidium botryosum (strain FD-172 SS1) TaxID=930990 RepID=A0A067MQC5_BOTB1|nr:hypothetical protein BOTBODRAFT_63678 [Botryobasidium botryosum FD-172 SS1]